MKSIISFLTLLVLTVESPGQKISGYVVDSANGQPLEYVSIGIINTTYGTITNEQGFFELDTKNQTQKSKVRISMISYKSQILTLDKFIDKQEIIKLIKDTIQISEVTVSPKGKKLEIGTKSFSRPGSWCGWGGNDFGRGNEIGTKISLGDSYVRLNSFHVHVQRQAFDTSLFRLHLRTISDTVPLNELLTCNIIVPITKETGWIDYDLSDYNIVLKGDIVVSLEWLKVSGLNENRAMKIGKKLQKNYVLFNTKRNSGWTYTKWGTEANWKMYRSGSPSFYLTVLK